MRSKMKQIVAISLVSLFALFAVVTGVQAAEWDKQAWLNKLEAAKKALRIQALSPGWRGSFEERLTKAGVPIEYGEEPREGEKCCGP